MPRAAWTLAAAVLTASGGPAAGQVVRLGPEFQVNAYTTGDQSLPSLAMADTGSFIVVWQSYGQDGSREGVFGRRFDAAGNPLGGELRANSFTTGDQETPAVSADGAGNFVVVWSSYDQDGSAAGIFGQRYAPSGAPVGLEFQVNAYTTDDQVYPAVGHDGTGDFVVVWTSYGQDRSYAGIFGRRYSAAGASLGGEFQVNSYTRDYQIYPAVAKDSSGRFVVAWQSYDQDRSDYAIIGQRHHATGARDGQDFQINTYTTGPQERPAVASTGAGSFIVAWESLQDGSGPGIFAQRFSAAGAALGGEFQVNTYTPFSQRRASVGVDGTGNFVVVWQSFLQDGSGYGVFGQRYTSAGDRRGVEFRVNSWTTGDQKSPRVAMDSAGGFVVVWESFGQDGSGSGIYAQRFSSEDCAALAVSTPSPQSACLGSLIFFSVSAEGTEPLAYRWRKDGLELSDGPGLLGTQTSSLVIDGVQSAAAGGYDCRVTDHCLPPSTEISGAALLSVADEPAPGPVSGLAVQKTGGGAGLLLTWADIAAVSDYVVFEDAGANGPFLTAAGAAASGATGLLTPMPPGNRFYLVAARTTDCGIGPRR